MDSQLYLIHLKICITHSKIVITDLKLSTVRTYPQKDLMIGTIQCFHGSFKIGKTHRACKELTKSIHGKIKVFSLFYGYYLLLLMSLVTKDRFNPIALIVESIKLYFFNFLRMYLLQINFTYLQMI